MTESVATYTVPQHHVDMFTANVRAAITRQGGKMRAFVTQGSYMGDKVQVVDFLGPIAFVERTTVYADTKAVEPSHTSRWVTGKDYDVAILVDRLDTLRMMYEPTSPYVERMREAAARLEDEIIMAAFYASARAGRNGTDTVAYNASNTIAHGSTRMSVAKLRSARKKLKKLHVDLRVERPLIAVEAEQIDDLLGETTVGSSEYNAVKPLVDGEVASFMGFTFVPMETIIPSYTSGSLIRQCPVWVPSGMHLASWQGLAITVGPRADKNNIKQIHGSLSLGATRLEEEKVLMLECVTTA